MIVDIDSIKGQSTSERIVELLRANSDLKHQLSRHLRAEQVLLATRKRLQLLLASSPVVIYSSQPSGDYGIVFISNSINQFGYGPQEFLENLELWKHCLHPDDAPTILAELSHLPNQGHCVLEYRFLHKNGDYRWVQDQRRLIRSDTGEALEIIGSLQDVTERKQMEQALFREKELAQNVLQSIGDAVITTDATGYIQYLNPVAEQITGWRRDQIKGFTLSEVFEAIHEVTRQPTANLVQKVSSSRRVVDISHSTVLISRDQTEYAINGSAAPILDGDNQIIGTVIVFRDVTPHHSLARKLSWQASHDFLTGLFNRREFEQRLEEAIATITTTEQHTLCYLDLDQFKVVNDTCGHMAGDELLRQVAALLQKRLRATDTLGRLGGDEFGILFGHCALEDAICIADQILRLIQGFRFVWQDNAFTIGASIGLVAIDDVNSDLNALLGAADAACYAAKSKGRNRIHVYQADDRDLVQQRGERQWVARILKALEEDRFLLYHQAIVPIEQGSAANGVVHHELLIRMISEEDEIIPPMAFIPAAERYGLMPMVDRWVISTFFARHKYFCQELVSETAALNCLWTINLSGASINDDQFLFFLKEQFALHDIIPETICFEITETAAIANLLKASEFVNEMKQIGCSFALDDFGSGMSSFAYLKNLPINYLKIDGSFVKNIINSSIDRTLVDCINRMGHEFGLHTIAEFVDGEGTLAQLKEIGVDYAQGYGIAKPTPLTVGVIPQG